MSYDARSKSKFPIPCGLCMEAVRFHGRRSLYDFLAHLSRRLIGELIGYSWSGVRLSSVVNNFKHTSPIKAKFYVEPPWVGGTTVCSQHVGHMTKMAATPIYSKNPSKSSSPEPAGGFSRNVVCNIGDSGQS